MTSLEAYAGKWFVVKIGGELAVDVPKLAASVGFAVREFRDHGIRVAVVHGGGPQASLLSKRLGLTPTQVRGQRVTDEETLEVMKMAVAGLVSVNVASAFRLARVDALCTSGVSAGLIEAVRRPAIVTETPEGKVEIDYGLVGDVTQVNVALFEKLAEAGLVPVVACLAGDSAGRVYNVNADTVAAKLALALSAAKLILVSNVPGVLRDKSDPSTRIPRLTISQARQYIADGIIVGGMIPKIEESLEMLQSGIEAIHIVGTSPDTSVLEEIAAPGSRGTVFENARTSSSNDNR